MSEFWLYFRLGWEHIADLKGYDHILFIVALACVYQWEEWKQLVLLLTAFTVGHCITLILASLDWITISPNLIEALIPATILFTCLNNLKYSGRRSNFQYILVTFFGLIHGMGFSNYFKSLLGSSKEIIFPLLSFNIGIEIGQILIVAFFLLIRTILSSFTQFSTRDNIIFISGLAAGPAIILLVERIFA